MKNIHVLATDKPSNLCINGKNFQNIYITSDEGIKEGDWVIHNNNIYKAIKNKGLYVLVKELNHIDIRVDLCQKIILTTDQDLIKDGVQAIDDEFLEWFVKNPSCEKVEVQKWSSLAECGYSYHIIIPQQEPKQEKLEEAIKKYSEIYRCPATNENEYCRHDIISAINFGAKWQQERMYSEEEVLTMLLIKHDGLTPEYVLEQFKKK